MDDEKKLTDEALEGVTGGELLGFSKPGYDPADGLRRGCPACGALIAIDAERVQCPKCRRWFRLEEVTLAEEQP